jgi:hypothetical protein
MADDMSENVADQTGFHERPLSDHTHRRSFSKGTGALFGASK